MNDAKIDIYAAIESCIDVKASTYAKNKQRGGSSGKKGSRYEDFYFAYKVALIASEYIDKDCVNWPFICQQIKGFVDDMQVKYEGETQYFQLKNASNVSWNAGGHSIETDFHYQYVLSTFLGEPKPTTTLVVSNVLEQHKLAKEVPNKIKKHSDVLHFPYCGDSLNRLVIENNELQEALKPLSRALNPSLDELCGVFGILILSGMSFPEGMKIDDLIKNTTIYHPSLLRPFYIANTELLLSDGFKRVVDGIQGLTYSVAKGFFSWNALGTSGILGFDCKDSRFIDFQDHVERQQPTTFDDFEGLLP